MMTKPLVQPSPLTIEIDSNLGELSRVRSFCRQVVDTFWPMADNEDVLASLQLAANEAVVNVIEHAYQLQGGRPIVCQATMIDQAVQFEIYHDGKSFESPEAVLPLDEPLECGMGLFLIEQSVSEVVYSQLQDGRQSIKLRVNLPES